MSCQEPPKGRWALRVRCRYNRFSSALAALLDGQLCFDGQTMRKNSEISMRAYELIAVGKAVIRL
jgi:hypothetical protein